MGNQRLLTIENLNLNYGNKQVVKGVSLSLNRGQVLGIAGESGSGKSTLLKGIIDPLAHGISLSGGIISYKGTDSSKWTKEKRQASKGTEIGMILQNPYTAFNPIRTYKSSLLKVLRAMACGRVIRL